MKPRQVEGTNYIQRARGIETAKAPQIPNELVMNGNMLTLGGIILILNV